MQYIYGMENLERKQMHIVFDNNLTLSVMATLGETLLERLCLHAQCLVSKDTSLSNTAWQLGMPFVTCVQNSQFYTTTQPQHFPKLFLENTSVYIYPLCQLQQFMF